MYYMYPFPHLRMEAGPVSEMLCSLVSRILDDGQVQKPSKSEGHTPSSEPLIFYYCLVLILSVLVR
jgi:hypothetical protein